MKRCYFGETERGSIWSGRFSNTCPTLPSAPGLPQSKHFLSCFPCSPFKIANWNKHGKFIVFDEHVRVFVLFSYRPNQLPYIPLLLVIARAVQLSYNLYNGTRFIDRRRRKKHTTSLIRNNDIRCQKILTNPTRQFFKHLTPNALPALEFWILAQLSFKSAWIMTNKQWIKFTEFSILENLVEILRKYWQFIRPHLTPW